MTNSHTSSTTMPEKRGKMQKRTVLQRTTLLRTVLLLAIFGSLLSFSPPKVVLDDFKTYSRDLYATLGDDDLYYEAFETAL